MKDDDRPDTPRSGSHHWHESGLPRIGEFISHYRILEELGGGGMGVVYKAEDTKLKRFVALKFLPPFLAHDPAAKKRFVREAQAASTLDHSNICTIHEIDEDQTDRLFICMAYYEGETLKRKIADGPMPVAEALNIARHLAQGLAKAHSEGIVHRDIKPANVMMTKEGEVKIVDFGLARLIDHTRITAAGTMLGTVSYMSPEQAKGEKADHRSDIFSVGVVLYELLTGKLPFPGDEPHAVMHKIIHDPPDPVSTHREDLPQGVRAVIDRALCKDPGGRYENALDLAEDLKNLQTKLDATQLLGTVNVDEARIGRGRTRKVGVGLLALAVVTAGIGWILTRGQPEGVAAESSVAVLDFQDLENSGELTQSVGLTGLVHVGLVESSPCRVVSPTYLYDLRRRLFGAGRGPIEPDQALDVAREAGATMLLTGQMMASSKSPYVTWQLTDTGDGSSLEAHRVDGSDLTQIADLVIAGVLPLLARQCRTEPPAPPLPVSTLTTKHPEAYRHYAAGMLAAEKSETQDAVRELERALEQDSTFALAAFELGRVYQYRMTDHERGAEYGARAWRHRSHLGVKDRFRLEAWLAQARGDVGDALPLYRELCDRWPDDRDALTDFASALFYYWNFHEAAEIAGQAFRLFPDDFDLGELACAAYNFAGSHDSALTIAHANLDRNPDHPEAWCDLGWSYLYIGKADSAEIMFRKSLEIDPSYLSGRRRGLSEVFYARGEMAKAIENWESILNRSDLLPGQRVSFLSRDDLGPTLPMLHAEVGRFQKALEILEDAGSGQTPLHYANKSRRTWLWRLDRVAEYEQLGRELAEVPGRTSIDRLRLANARGLLCVAQDSLDAARGAVETLRELSTQVGKVAEAWAFELDARIELAEGDAAAALAALSGQRSVVAQPGGMVDIQHRENLARAYYMVDRLDDAAEVLEQLLRRYRGHAISHYELGKIYEEMNQPDQAAAEYMAFLDAWFDADEGLPQVTDAKNRLATLRTQTE